MMLTINKRRFMKYLNYCNEIVTDNLNNPIFSFLLIEVKKEQINFICSNFYINAKFTLKDSYEIDEEFSFLLKFKQLNNLISKIESDEIQIIKTLNKNITIKNDKLECNLNIYDENEYPIFNFECNINTKFDVQLKILKEIRDRVAPSCSLNTDQIKPINGVNFEFSDNNELITVATDSFKVSRLVSQLNFSNLTEEFVIYSKTYEKMYHLLSLDNNENDFITIAKKESELLISSETQKLSIKLLSGNFPRTSRLFEMETVLNFEINKNEFYNSIDRAKTILTSEKMPIIKLDVRQDVLEIETNCVESGYFTEKIKIKNLDNKEVSFKLNANYLLSILKLFPGEELKIGISSSDKPIILFDLSNSSFNQIILPVRS